jgi:hypothetical protein
VDGLVGFEFEEEGVERFEVVGGRVGVEVEDRGEREAEEEVVCCAAGQVARREGGETREVGFGEEERVEPVDAALVAGGVLVLVWKKGHEYYLRFSEVVQCGDAL